MGFWDDLQQQAANPTELKKQLDLVAVCGHLGITLEDTGGGRWVTQCPFHDDNDPSFAVWWDNELGHQRCGCWSCHFSQGDVFDLLAEWYQCDFGAAMREAKKLADMDLPRPEAPPERPLVDQSHVAQAAYERAREDVSGLRTLLRVKDIAVPAEWVRDEFKVGVTVDGSGIVIPHSRYAVKYRVPPNWTAMASEGSKLSELYGAWRDHGQRRVIICEGESDTWTTAWVFRDQRDVLVVGLPSGAMAHPRAEWLEMLAGRDVTLLFDADDAGRRAMRNWVDVLQAFSVSVAVLQDGDDATTAGHDAIRKAVQVAQDVSSQAPPQLTDATGGYTRASSGTAVSNFTLELSSVVSLDGEEIAFEVCLPDGRLAYLTTHDLGSDARMVAWSNSWGYVWYGSRKDAQELMRMLMMESVFVSHTKGTRVVGWHDGSFVFPDNCVIGPASYSYVPPIADVHIGENIDVSEGDWSSSIIDALIGLHTRDVMSPLLGWIAAAPLRGEVGRAGFPVMAVVGGSGWGKTTLVDEVLRTFGWNLNITLTATTPHAVHSFIASTSSVPVWVDEYRYGARSDSKLALDQTIRDAWDMGSSVKGGLGENKQELSFLKARAPLIITGEDAFHETSHAERMTIISIPREGRSARALEHLRGLDRVGFGRAYLEWIVEAWHNDEIPAPPKIPDRPLQARAVCAWGWELLEAFCGVDLGPFDETRVAAEHADLARVPVVIELLTDFVGRADRRGYPIVWQDSDDVCVRIMDFVTAARKETDVTLPGGSRATRKWLEERFDCEEGRNSWGPFLRMKDAASEIL